MKFALIFITLIFSISTFAQPYNQTDKQGRKIGQWKKVYGNGKVRYTGQFKADVPYGTFNYYDENGNLITVIKHSNDGHSSVCTMYYNDKKLRATGFYYDQLKDSTWVYYSDRTNAKVKEENYRKGKKHGAWRVYYESGMLYSEIYYANDLEHGSWKEFFENGNKTLESNYLNGKLNGRYTTFFSSGDTNTTGFYNQGVRDGVWKFFGKNHQIEKIEYIRNGLTIKEEIFKNGVLVETRRKGMTIKE